MPLSAMIEPEPANLTVNHSFIASIFVERTNIPLFISAILDPTQASSTLESQMHTDHNGHDGVNTSPSSSTLTLWSLLLQLTFLSLGRFILV